MANSAIVRDLGSSSKNKVFLAIIFQYPLTRYEATTYAEITSVLSLLVTSYPVTETILTYGQTFSFDFLGRAVLPTNLCLCPHYGRLT